MGNMPDNKIEEDLIFFSNGPGEISTWVFPIAEKIKKNPEISKKYQTILIIHPCQFSSGTEHIYTSKLSLFDKIVPPKDYIKLIFGLQQLKKYSFKRRGIIISLGGDLVHPVLFRFRSRGKYKLFAYTNNPGWSKKYEKIFVRNNYVKKKALENGINPSKILVSGDLVFSSIKVVMEKQAVRDELSLTDNDTMMLFMPGSREFEVKYMLPVFLKVISEISNEFGNIKPFILKSPYVDYSLFEKALLNAVSIKEAVVESGELVNSQNHSGVNNYVIKTKSGKVAPVLERGLEYWSRGVDFAVTLPGTNTIQLAYRNIPALVVAALNKPEIIPIEGIAGLLKWIPGGKIILKKAAQKYIKGFQFASLPNIYTQREIFPELFGVIKTEDIVEKLRNILIGQEIKKIKERLTVFKFNASPADLILKEIFKN